MKLNTTRIRNINTSLSSSLFALAPRGRFFHFYRKFAAQQNTKIALLQTKRAIPTRREREREKEKKGKRRREAIKQEERANNDGRNDPIDYSSSE